MKFLCPSCKAKYQIADEKVSGRAVRMKCRKCGFVIPLSEIPPAPSTEPPSQGPGALPVVPKAPLAPNLGTGAGAAPASPSAAGDAPGKAPPRRPTLADVALGAPKPVIPTTPGTRPAAPSAPGTASAGIPAPPGRPAVPSVARPATKAPVPKSTATPGAKPESPAPASSAAAVVANAASSAAAVSLLSALDEEDDENDDSTHILKGGALADAFGALVGGSPADGPNAVVGMPADEWFVGINDVPVGPIRLGEIRKKAILGAVTPQSMVWRDGLEAWRPLKTFPELLAVLEESVSSIRAAGVPFLAPGAADGVANKSDADSFGAVGAAGGITGPAVVTDDLAIPGARPRSPMFAWLAVLVALAFGITIGFVVWSKQKPPETIVKYVEVPAKGPEAPAAAVNPQAVDLTSPEASAAATKARAGGATGSGKASAKASDADKQPGGTGLTGLKGLSGLGPSGPGVTSTGPGSGPASGGGQLDAAQTQSTVARYTGSVKRSCWQPALDARDPSAPTSARVMVTITVGPSGSVQNVSTNGDPRGYPGLAGCIGGRVRAWQFPATGGTTTVNVPFVFAAQ
jgi:predicted Zn finger-like uncharacterized protein